MPAGDASTLHTLVVRDTEGLDRLQTEWSALQAESDASSPFLRYAWIRAWWHVFGEAFRLHVVVVRDGAGRLCGVAPTMIGRGPGRLGRRLRHLMWIGQEGDTLAEHLDVLVPRGREDEVVPLLAAAWLDARAAWDVCWLERVREDSATLPPLERAFAAAGVPLGREGHQASPYLPLPSSWDDLTASWSRNFRRQWNNARNRLEKEGELRLRVAGEDLTFDDAFDRLVELHRARWGPDDGSFRTEAYLQFHRRFGRALLDAGDLELVLLEVGGRAIAARYDFIQGTRLFCFQGGWLREFERMRAGTVLTGLVLERAIARGLDAYEFLSGEDAYKRRWATGEHGLVDLRAEVDRARVRWIRRFRRWKDALRRRDRP